MAVSQQTKKPSLREAIEAFLAERDGKPALLDEDLKLLSRLAKSEEAAKAFVELETWLAPMPGYSNVHGGNFLNWCIMARLLIDERYGFCAQIIEAKKTLLRMKRLDKTVALLRKIADEKPIGDLRKFADEENIVGLRKIFDVENTKELNENLDLVDSCIVKHRRNAEDTEPRLTASRKTNSKKAAENAAIWLLAANIVIATRKPHERLVADLAAIILGKKPSQVSVERVHSVIRLHKPRFLKRIRRQAPKARG